MRIQTISLVLATSILLSGCASFSLLGSRVKPLEIQTKAVERTPLNLEAPAPLKSKPVEWILITPQNAEEVWAKLKEKNADLVLFGLTDDGYEELSMTMAELRNYIAAQRQLIIKYKEYYEPKKEEKKPEEKK